MNQKNIDRSIELRMQKQAIDAEMKELNTAILEDLQSNELKSHKTDFGTFKLRSKKIYEYDDKVIKAEALFKKKQTKFKEDNEPSEITYSLEFAKPKA